MKLVDCYDTDSPTPFYWPLLLSTAPVAAALASLFDLPEILALAFDLVAWTMLSAGESIAALSQKYVAVR
jgi:hypothetical protein